MSTMKTLLTTTSVLALAGLALGLHSPSTTSAPSSPPALATYQIDAGHSAVVFRCKHLGVSQFWGRFNQISGELRYDEEDPTTASIQCVIPADSIDTNSADRDRHLKSNDFLSAKEFPELTFTSQSVEATDDGLVIKGELSMHGVTKDVTAQAEVVGSGETMFNDFRMGFEARFRVDMRDFGITFVEKNATAVGPEVDLIVSLECIRQG